MAVTVKKLARKSGRVARKAVGSVQTKVLAAVGRQAVKRGVKRGVKTARTAGKAAMKKALTAAALAAAGAVYQELRGRRKRAK